MICTEQDTTELCRLCTDSLIDEFTACVDLWLIWNALPKGNREAIRLRIYNQLKNITACKRDFSSGD